MIEWKSPEELIKYPDALQWMDNRVKDLQLKQGSECVWLLEHPPLYTMGTSGKEKDVLQSKHPVFKSGRGGQVTYHGPGQRVVYLMLDLNTRYHDIRRYVFELEEWIIQTLSAFSIEGERRPGRVGIWVQHKGQDHKIAALGVRVQKWVTSHGIAINVYPDLGAYQDIIPCGLKDYGVTSLADLGLAVTLPEVDEVLLKTFPFERPFDILP
ncbi:MAG: lipoyl(octanoyl) transferase LipB [Alphaproteobacteria bacterium]|nr:lipoyl(octanoyl) transferase LipB [Alphaproteobacteria bacterium]